MSFVSNWIVGPSLTYERGLRAMTKADISLIAAVLRPQLVFAQTYESNAPASCLLNAVYALSGALADSVDW